MVTLGPKQVNVKVVPVNIDCPSHVIIDIERYTQNTLNRRRYELCWKAMYAWFIVSIVQYGVGIMTLMLFMPKSYRDSGTTALGRGPRAWRSSISCRASIVAAGGS